MLRVINLQSGYGALAVLDGASLHIDAGEVVALLGSNGAGKSTLMKTIAGLIAPTGGRLLLDEHNIAGWPAERVAARGVTLVPEGRGLFPRLSVLDNLRMGGYARRLRPRKIAQNVEEVFNLFPALRAKQGQPAGNLSGGQQQMVALARALVGEPSLLLLDEPSTGLAPMLVIEIFAMVKQLKEAGKTILLAEQNVQQALQIADRAYVLENGRVALDGPAASLIASETIQHIYLGL